MGYSPKANKSWLIGKAEKYETAKVIFKDTNLNITNKGKRHLGTVVDSEEFKKEYVVMRVNEWVAEVKLLTKIAHSHPVLDKSSTTLFEPYPTAAIYYNPSKMSFDGGL